MGKSAGIFRKIFTLIAVGAAVLAVIFFLRCGRALQTEPATDAVTGGEKTDTAHPESIIDIMRKASEKKEENEQQVLAGGFDAYAAKINSRGEIVWGIHFDSPNLESAEYAAACPDGSLIIAGREYNPDGGKEDFFLKKISSKGVPLWEKKLSEYDYSIADSINGGFMIAGKITKPGTGENSFYIAETDEKGDYRKVINFSREFAGWGYRSIESDDGAYLTVGLSETEFAGAGGIHLSKKNKKGAQEWSRVYGGDEYDRGFSIDALPDGVLIAGMTSSFGEGGMDAYFVKADFDGNCVWARSVGTADNEEVYSAIKGGDGNIHACGVYSSQDESGLLYMALDAGGFPVKMIRFKGALNCAGFAIAQAEKNEFYIAGIRRK